MRALLLPGCVALSLIAACDPADVTSKTAQDPPSHAELMAGGRLFDMWYDESDAEFVPDDEDTPEIDGKGGPNGNGTLNGADGLPIANTGHDYRFKNLFGWDMLGDAGIYGRDYQAKPWVLDTGPLSPAHMRASRSDWITRIKNGWADLPAYGSVLKNDEIALLVDFMLAVRGRPPAATRGSLHAGHGSAARLCAECGWRSGARP